jgi:glycosyltransferase involved in cell wall biosynthesis
MLEMQRARVRPATVHARGGEVDNTRHTGTSANMEIPATESAGRSLRVAIVHYWLVNMRGGEKVVEALCELFPQAEIFTHVYVPEAISERIRRHKIHTTFIQRLPQARKRYQSYLPLMPLALQQLDLRDFDLVISSESGPAKGVIVSPDARHICYCHSPMRYVWDMYPDYLAGAGRITRWLMPPLIHYLRLWDRSTADGVDAFVANSNYVASRINRYYRREAEVIAPPVQVEDFSADGEVCDFYLMMGQLVSYKRPDLVVDAFNESGRRLVVIGEGEMQDTLRQRAGPNITFMGRQPFEVIREYLSRCRALVFPGLEDFGIVPVEAMAAGRPVIAYGKGGALDTVVDGRTGILFKEQSVASLNGAIARYESSEMEFHPAEMAFHASQFSKERFKQQFMACVESTLDRRE